MINTLKEFIVENVIKKKGSQLYVKWKGYDNSFKRYDNSFRQITKTQYKCVIFPEPNSLGGRGNAAKADLKNEAGVYIKIW